MTEMYLHRDDLAAIIALLDSFKERDVVLIKQDTSSGIGAITTATVVGVDVNGHKVDVTKTICDETSW